MALPPGITPKTVTVGIASFFDGSLAEGTATITAPVNVVHTPSNRPIFSSQMSHRFVDGETSFNLAPTDAPGLNRVDWTYKLNVVISGALVQPEPVYFILPTAGPDTIDLDSLVTVPSSAGTPISVDVLTTEDLPGHIEDYLTANPPAPSGGAGGALSGEYPNPGFNVAAVESLVVESDAVKTAFVRLAPPPTGVAATDDANLRALNTEVAETGGKIRLHPGRYRLAAPLPPLPGVQWEGAAPAMRQVTITTGAWLADGMFDFETGTVLEGDGTFAAIEGNATDMANLPSDLGNYEIPGFGAVGIGFDNFTYGLHVGAANVMGLSHGKLDQLFFKRCNKWAVKLVNFAHMTIGDLRGTAPANNGADGVFYFGASITSFQPGNSTIGELYAYLLPTSPKTRGIRFHAEGDGGGSLAHVDGRRIQVNRFGTPKITDTVTFTSGSSDLAVATGSKFAPGMPVQFATTNYGVRANQIYIVRSVVGNTLTLAHNTYGPAIVATGTGSLAVSSYGMANIEWTVREASSNHVTPQFLNIDSEGVVSVGVYAENCYAGWLGMGVRTENALMNVVFRSVGTTQMHSPEAATTDFDATSSASVFFGSRKSTVQYPLRGLWHDATRLSNVLGVGNGYSSTGNNLGDLESRSGGFLYPFFGVGERFEGANGASTLSGDRCGNIIFSGGSAQTYTLPTILPEAPAGNSHLGMWFDILNVGSAPLTVATDGTQTFNKVAGSVSTTVAPGQALRVVAVRDSTSTIFWSAKVSATVGNSVPIKIPVRAISAATTLVAADAGKAIEAHGGSPLTVTVPPNSTVPFDIGTVIELAWIAAKVTIQGGTGVTVFGPTGSPLSTRAEGSTIRLRKRDTNQWVVSGDLG